MMFYFEQYRTCDNKTPKLTHSRDNYFHPHLTTAEIFYIIKAEKYRKD